MQTAKGRFFDGETARDVDVQVALSASVLAITLPDGHTRGWSLAGLRAINPPIAGHLLRLSHSSFPGARLSLDPSAFTNEILLRAPHLHGGLNLRRFFRYAGIAVICLAAVIAAGYLLFSYAPQQIAFLMPDAWRSRLGDQVEKSFVREAPQCTSPAGVAALDQLAARIREGNPNLPPFSLRVYRIPVINAFALPGGRVVFFSELIDKASSPAEVAGILGHELGHVAMRHSETQLVRAIGLQLVISLATGGGGSETLGGFAGLLAMFSYSRDAENDADGFGLATLKNAEIDPLGLKRFFETISKEEGEPLSGVFGRIGNMMSTHPVTADRIKKIKPLASPARPVLTDSEWRALKSICS